MSGAQPPERDPRAELELLAGGLRRIARRKARGARRVPASGTGAVPAEAPADARPGGAAAARGSAARARATPIVPQAPQAPLRSFEMTPRPAAAPSAALAAAERLAAEVRARARACADLASLREAVAACTACGLCRTRTQTVFADGAPRARLMFVGEAPGESEDLQGVPFVGRAGALLSDIITKGMGLARSEVHIANVLKCRPPQNRDPSEVEKATCTPWLDRQIELVDPEVIVPLGRHAASHVLGTQASIGALRGRVHERGGRKVVATFHPAYLLRSPGQKKECWKDIQIVMGLLGLSRPPANEPSADFHRQPRGPAG